MKENKMMCDRQKECLACTNRSCMMAGIEDPKLGEECGVFGMYDMDGGDVASSIYYGLFSLQHRGQESCGIAVYEHSEMKFPDDQGNGTCQRSI